jgi:hypothetical protein
MTRSPVHLLPRSAWRVQVDIGHRLGVAMVDRGKLDDLARRLESATCAGGGHIFLPLQVGAWTRL